MSVRRRGARPLAAVALVVLAVACGGSDDSVGSSVGDESATVSAASLDGLEFEVRRDPG